MIEEAVMAEYRKVTGETVSATLDSSLEETETLPYGRTAPSRT
jgi:hypothetical protein